MQLFFDQFLKFWLAEKVFHYVQTVINRLLVFQRKHHPTFQHTGTHRTDSFIDDIEQTTSTVVHATDKLQAAHGKFIQTHIFVLFNARQCRDVSDLRMLRHIQVLQNSPGSNDTVFKMLYSETFQILCFKVLQQFLAWTGLCKSPIVQFESKEFVSEIPFEHTPFATFEKHLFRTEIIQQFIYIIKRAFRRQKFTGRDIEKGDATTRFSEMYSC